MYWSLWLLFNLLSRLLLRFRVEGEHFFPQTGGVIVAANHASYFDIPLLGCAINRRVVFLGRATLFPNPVLSWMLQRLGWIPLKTHRLDRKAFDVALKHLKIGIPVVIFPEGSRTEDGQLQPGKPGVGFLVKESGCQVIPAYISGTFNVLPVKAKWPRLFPVTVFFGELLNFSNASTLTKKQEYEYIGQAVMDKIAHVGGISSSPQESGL